jgi:hypothetical protein
MDEYIKREELVLKVKRNLMPNVDADGTVSVENAERYFLNLLEEQPAEDVVEVVRCLHCQHFKTNVNKENYCDIHSTIWDKFYVRYDDYCSYGERR